MDRKVVVKQQELTIFSSEKASKSRNMHQYAHTLQTSTSPLFRTDIILGSFGIFTNVLMTSVSSVAGLAGNLTFHYQYSERQQGLVFMMLHTYGHSYPCYSSKQKYLGCLIGGSDKNEGKKRPPFPTQPASLADGFFCFVKVLDNIIPDLLISQH